VVTLFEPPAPLSAGNELTTRAHDAAASNNSEYTGRACMGALPGASNANTVAVAPNYGSSDGCEAVASIF
jgi:hypothetical protein